MCWRGVDFHSKRPRSVWQPVKVIVAEPSRSEPFSAPNATLSPSCQIASLSADSAAPVIVSGGGNFPAPVLHNYAAPFRFIGGDKQNFGFSTFYDPPGRQTERNDPLRARRQTTMVIIRKFLPDGDGEKKPRRITCLIRTYLQQKKKQRYYTRTKNEVFIAFQ